MTDAERSSLEVSSELSTTTDLQQRIADLTARIQEDGAEPDPAAMASRQYHEEQKAVLTGVLGARQAKLAPQHARSR